VALHDILSIVFKLWYSCSEPFSICHCSASSIQTLIQWCLDLRLYEVFRREYSAAHEYLPAMYPCFKPNLYVRKIGLSRFKSISRNHSICPWCRSVGTLEAPAANKHGIERSNRRDRFVVDSSVLVSYKARLVILRGNLHSWYSPWRACSQSKEGERGATVRFPLETRAKGEGVQPFLLQKKLACFKLGM
jgi:hypothetical protein